MPRRVYQLSDGEKSELMMQLGGGWKATPPEETGWYWAYCPTAAYDKLECLHILMDYQGKPFDAVSIQTGIGGSVEEYTHWLGPLPVPEPPGESD